MQNAIMTGNAPCESLIIAVYKTGNGLCLAAKGGKIVIMIHSGHSSSNVFFSNFFLTWTNAETISVQPVDWLLCLEITAPVHMRRCVTWGQASSKENASDKHSDVCTDVMVQLYLEGKCSISWAF